MHLSVLVTVFNASPYLDACIRSVLTQSDPDLELVLVDDGSTDGSGTICDRFAAQDRRVRVLHTTNRGVFLARAAAEEHARGEYLLHVDADDSVEPTLSETIRRAAEQHHPALISFDYSLHTPDGTVQRESFFDADTFFAADDMQPLYRLLLTTRFNTLCNKCFRRDLIDCAPDYLHYPRLRHGEDLLRSAYLVTSADAAVYVHASLYNYRTGVGTSGAFQEDTLPNYDTITQRVRMLLQSKIEWDASWQADWEFLCRCQLRNTIRAMAKDKLPPKTGEAILRRQENSVLFRSALENAPDTAPYRMLRRGKYRRLLRLYRAKGAFHAQ